MTEPTPVPQPAPMPEMVRNVLYFLRAGGHVTWSEWCRMDARTRGAFVAANRQIEVERAIRQGRATMGAEGVLDVMSEADGGEERERVLVAAAGRAAAERVRGA